MRGGRFVGKYSLWLCNSNGCIIVLSYTPNLIKVTGGYGILIRGGRVSRFLCIEKSGEKLAVPAKTWYTLQGELVENEHSKNGSSIVANIVCALWQAQN